MARSYALTAVAVLAVGCNSTSDNVGGTVVRDSSGVYISETTPTAWPPPQLWRIPSLPDVDIGSQQGDPDYELFQVSGAVVLDHGGIVVAEFGASLRFYDRSGMHVRTLNRSGRGPGEAESFAQLQLYRGDSLLIVTGQMTAGRSLVQLLVLDSAGGYGRNIMAWYPGSGPGGTDITWLAGNRVGFQTSLADGSLWVAGSIRLDLSAPPGSLVYGEQGLIRLTPDGTLLDTVARLRSGMYELRTVEQRRYELMLDEAEPTRVRQHNMTAYFATGEHYVADTYTIPAVTTDNAAPAGSIRLGSYRIRVPLTPATEESRNVYIRRVLELSLRQEPQGIAAYRARLNSLKSPDSIPAVQDLHVDELGNIWLELYQAPGAAVRRMSRERGTDIEEPPSLWVVLSAEGGLLGSVALPASLQVLQIGSDFVLGLWFDTYGVPYVRRYRIDKHIY